MALQGYPINHPNSMFISKIMGGSEAKPTELPFQVRMEYDFAEYLCGGVIITPLLILTAAHCLYEKSADKFKVIAGDHIRNDRSGNEQERTISRIIIHEQFNSKTFENDIALMVLHSNSPFIFNSYVNKVEYKHSPANWIGSATVSGWGQLEHDADPYNKLQKVDIPLVSRSDCEKHYVHNELKEKMFCAGRPGKDACRGDSGGPLSGYLVSTGVRMVVGIVAFGQKCIPQEHKVPGVYTNISKYGSWIEQAIRNLQSQGTIQKSFDNNCKLDEFHCVAQNKCITSRWICDGDRDCNDGSDEAPDKCNCKGKLICKSGNKCIDPSWKCDRDRDCPGGEDEVGCSFG